VQPANSFGTNAASGPYVASKDGPRMLAQPGKTVPIGAETDLGWVEGAVEISAPDGAIVIVLEATLDGLRCLRTVPALHEGLGEDPAYGGRPNELVLTDEEVLVPLEKVRGAALLVTRALIPWLKGFTDGRPLYWFERRRSVGQERQYRPPPDAVLDGQLERWAASGELDSPRARARAAVQHSPLTLPASEPAFYPRSQAI
jgi:hypothetical protein